VLMNTADKSNYFAPWAWVLPDLACHHRGLVLDALNALLLAGLIDVALAVELRVLPNETRLQDGSELRPFAELLFRELLHLADTREESAHERALEAIDLVGF
jgi:hypothetical protein